MKNIFKKILYKKSDNEKMSNINFHKSILIMLLFISYLFSSSTIMAQSNNSILPEKAMTPIENNDNTNTVPIVIDENIPWATGIVAIMFVGLFLLFLEIAVIPGVGITGISGSLLLIISLALAFWKLTKIWAIAVTIFAVISVILLILFMFFVLPHTRLGKRLLALESAPTTEGSFAVESTDRFLYAEGIADSNLRPSGIARINNERVTVITEGGFIEKGTKIKVIKTTGGQIIVDTI